jgi:uncharacterized protein
MVEVTDRPERRPARVPQRTCVGCRGKAPRSVLMRIVAVRAGEGSPEGAAIAELDLRRRHPGRGAWLHPSPDCLDLALRRRALTRALRVAGPLDTSGLAGALAEVAGRPVHTRTSTTHQVATPADRRPPRRRSEPEAGYSADEHPMSTQQ